MMNDSLNIAIAGATGYVGLELVRILSKHPKVKILYLCGKESAGKSIYTFDKRINLFKVSEGLGSHLPEPCSEQLGPLDTIVPAGNKNISTYLKDPCSFF